MEPRLEPAYQPAYRCRDPKCGGWRFKSLADAERAKGCLRCGGPFAPQLVLRAVRQRGQGQPAGALQGDGKGKGKGKPAGGAKAATGQPLAAGLVGGGVSPKPQHEPVQPGPQPVPGGDGARAGGGRHRGRKPGPAQQPQPAARRTQIEILQSNVDNAKELDGVDSEEYRRAAHRLQDQRRKEAESRTPEEVFNDLKRRVAQQRDILATRLEDHTRAHQALEVAQTRVGEAEGDLNGVFTELEELESKFDEAEQRVQPPIMAGPQIKEKDPMDPLIAQLEAVLASGPKDTGFVQRTQETLDELRARQAEMRNHEDQAREAQKARDAADTATTTVESHVVIPEVDAPWQISTGTKAHARLLERGSTATQQRVLDRLTQKNKGKKGKPIQSAWQQEGGIHNISDFPTAAQARETFQRMEVQSAANQARAGAATAAGTPPTPLPAARGSLAAAAGAQEDVAMAFGITGQRRKREDSEEDPELRDAEERPSFRRGGEGDPLT